MSLSAAEAWALAAKVAYIDRKHCAPQEAREKTLESLALTRRAMSLDSDPLLCVRAQAYLSQPWPAPAEHYDRPMSTAELKRVYGLRAAMNRKPTKRRGTKPSSLPNRLAAACHTLKEP